MAVTLLTAALTAQPAGQQALFEFIDGEVSVLRNGQNIEAFIGDLLAAEDRIITGSNGVAVIALGDRGVLKLQPNTELRLEDLDLNMTVELRSGSLFSRLDRLRGGSFNVRAGSALAGVRGTEFFTAFGKTIEDQPDVWLCVNEGLVEVRLDTGESVEVGEGEGINILSGRDITPPQFFAWTENLNWNMDPELGDIRDNTDLNSLYDDPLDFDYD